MRAFLNRRAMILVLGITLSVALALGLWYFKQESKLPGLRDQVSDLTKEELNVEFEANKHVLGGWIFLRNYDAQTYPIIHFWTRHPIAVQFIQDFKRKQTSKDEGIASVAVVRDPNNASANTADHAVGTIRCVPTEKSVIRYYTPDLPKFAKTLCLVSLPPFSSVDEINLQIVVITDLDVDQPEIREVRKTLLRLQIDIYSRDYLGHETWIRPTANTLL